MSGVKRRAGRWIEDHIMLAKNSVVLRVQIQLEERQYRRLRSLGTRSGKGLAELVREAIAGRITHSRDWPQPS